MLLHTFARSFLALGIALAPLVAAPFSAVRAEGLDAEAIELKVLISDRHGAMVDMLRDWVDVNTGSWNTKGLENFAGRLSEPLRTLGFEVETVPGSTLDLPDRPGAQTGPVLIARRAAAGHVDKPLSLLLVGHFDTVFELDSPFQRFRIAKDGRATGPGVADMKGGLVVLFEALRALAVTGDLDLANWTVLLNSDEETGSLGSRHLIEAEARRADLGFVFESSQGGMVRSRRGLGQFYLRVDGVAAHAGSAHEQGRSAVHEMAAKILRIEALTDYTRGLTLNVGTVRGGTKRNIVPERAEVWIDLRYDAPALGQEAQQALEAATQDTVVYGTTATLWGRLHRPPKLATPEVNGLLARHRAVAESLAVELPEARHAGGGTDGSLMGAMGLATLDSMGVVGGSAHTDREFVELASLPERTTIAALLLRSLARERVYGHPDGR